MDPMYPTPGPVDPRAPWAPPAAPYWQPPAAPMPPAPAVPAAWAAPGPYPPPGQPAYPYPVPPPAQPAQGVPVLRFRDLFRGTFKRHSRDELDELMSSKPAGPGQWRLPWLYARVFLVLLVAFGLFAVSTIIWPDEALYVVPQTFFIGAMAIPVMLMVFFWEADQSRGLGLLDIVRFFFIGGAVSMVLGFPIRMLTGPVTGQWEIGGIPDSIFTGVTEEFTKAVAVILLAWKLRGVQVSKGLAIGMAVGAGFEAFEAMGYAGMTWVDDVTYWFFDGKTAFDLGGGGYWLWEVVTRGVTGFGGHTVWAAITGAALMMAQRPGAERIRLATMNWGKFLAWWCVPVVLHAVWDFFAFNIESDLGGYAYEAVMIAAAWVILARFVNVGFRQHAALLAPRPGGFPYA